MTNTFENALNWVKMQAVFQRLETVGMAAYETMEAYGSEYMKRRVLACVLQDIAVSAYQDGYAAGAEACQLAYNAAQTKGDVEQ